MNISINLKLNSSTSRSVLRNSASYQFLAIFSIVYMSIMLCNAILTNRYIGTDTFFILGGTLTSPFIFILDDIIAEIYGFKMARCVILTGFAAQTLFVIICQLVVLSPSPSYLKTMAAYSQILGTSLLQINISGFIAYIVANLINSYILTRWKILLKGRKFWLRSLFSSIFSEALYSFIAILMMEINILSRKDVMKVIIISYLIKATYSLLFTLPANALVNYVKNITGIDVYDFPQKLTPFKYLPLKRS